MYNRIGELILLSFSCFCLFGFFINSVLSTRWILYNKSQLINATIISYRNYEGDGFWWSTVEISYQYLNTDVHTFAKLKSIPVEEDDKFIKIIINRNVPTQFVTVNKLCHFLLIEVLLFPFFTVFLIKRVRLFINSAKTGAWEEENRKSE